MGESRRAEPAAVGGPGRESASFRFAPAEGHADVAVLVVTHQNANDIEPLVASLRPETVEQTVRVVVADNASTDKTADRAREHPDLIVVDTGGNLGYGGGINVAMALAGDADAILILNPDLTVERHCVQRLLHRMRKEGAGIVVPAILGPDGTQSHSLRNEPSLLRALGDAVFGSAWPRRPGPLTETVRDPRAYAAAHPVMWATGAALLIGREAAERVGPWDDRFFLYSEETDYFRRVREAGYEVWYEPSARVTHAEGGSGRSPELVALTVVNSVRYAEKHEPGSAAARRTILALHEFRRWRDPSHRIARSVLLDRRKWGALPHATRTAGVAAPTVDHLLLTRFNLPSEGAESLIRAQDGWLQDRVELFEKHTVPSVRAQTTSDFTWVVYFDTESPAWLIERLRPLADEHMFVPLYREVVVWTDVLDDARRITAAAGDVLLTTNLDNDDAIAVDFVERLQSAARPGVREALFLAHGLIRSGDRLFLRTDRHNAFCSVAEPWDGAMTAWRDWHILLGRHMPVRAIEGAPGWLQIIHDRNVSNRIRGRLESPTPYRALFAGQLDDLSAPSAGTRLIEAGVRRPIREIGEAVRSAGKAVALRILGKDGLGRLREQLRRRGAH